MTPTQLKVFMTWIDARIAESKTTDLHETIAEQDARAELYSEFGFVKDRDGDPMEGPTCDTCGRELVQGSCAICNPFDPFEHYEVVPHPDRDWGYAVRVKGTKDYWKEARGTGRARYWAKEKDARKFIKGLG